MFLLCLLLVVLSASSFSKDPEQSTSNPKSVTRNLERGALARIEDATVTNLKRTLVEQVYRSINSDVDKETQILETNVFHGYSDTLELRLSVPVNIGKTSMRGNRDTVVGVIKNLYSDPIGYVPEVAVTGSLRLPTGEDSFGIGFAGGILATKNIGKNAHDQRLLFNATWKNNAEPKAGEANNGYEIVLGYDTPLSSQTVLILSAFQESDFFTRSTTRMAELATRTSVDDNSSFGLSLGKGLDDSSPDLMATATFTIAAHGGL